MKRCIALVMTVVIYLVIGAGAQAEKEYHSIVELINTTPEYWTATYETQWRTVDVDVPISVPKVEAFPVICVAASSPVDASLLASYQRVRYNSYGIFEACTSRSDETIKSNWRYKSKITYPGTETEIPNPENVTDNYSDVYNLARNEIERLLGSSHDLVLEDITVMSCFYRFENKGGQVTWYERKTDTGKYTLHFRPRYHGIAYQSAEECYDKLRLSQEKLISDSRVTFIFYSKENYKLLASLYDEVNIVYEDVPLLSFDEAKTAIEELIYAGYLRSVETVELCYIPYLDPNDNKILWLLPAWYVRGGYTRDPEREFTPYLDKETGAILDDGIERTEVIFQAQLGTLIDYYDSRKSRRNVPEILTWEDIK